MELYQLQTFAAVAELGSLTQASARLHVSQPAASAQIKALEKEFGIALFERKHNGLTLTRAGAALLPEIRKLLGTAAGLALHAKGLRGRLSGTIKVAIVPRGASRRRRIARFKAKVPRTDLRHPRQKLHANHQGAAELSRRMTRNDLHGRGPHLPRTARTNSCAVRSV